MAHQPGPIMSYTGMPQQKLHLVPNLPMHLMDEEVTEGVEGIDGVPKKLPSGAYFLVQVEWAWSPAHNRITNYHVSLSSDRSRWVFWESNFEDEWHWKFVTSENVLTLPKKGFTRREAALVLLKKFWEKEALQYGLDHFHWIAETGFLDVGETSEIARLVWGEGKTEEDETL